MRKLLRLSIILISTLFIVGCGQSFADQIESAQDAPIHTTEIKEKLLLTSTDLEEESLKEDQEENAETENDNFSSNQTESSTDQSDEEESKGNEVTTGSRTAQSESETNNNKNSKTSEGKTTTESQENNSKSTSQKNKNKEENNSKNSGNSDSKEENSTPPTPPKKTVTVKIESPSDLNGPNMGPITVEIEDGETVFSATEKAIGTGNIKSRGSGAMLYVEAIGGLKEYDAGPLSGWNFYVNGTIISHGSGTYEVSDGDSILWKYTTNYLE